jgi:hypothetical protein
LYYEPAPAGQHDLHDAVAKLEHKDFLNTLKLNAAFDYSTGRTAAGSDTQ